MTTLETITKTNLEAQLKGNNVLPLNIIGPRGIGKTSLIKTITKGIDSSLLHISIPAKSLEFFGGLPVFTDMPGMAKYSRSNSLSIQGTLWTAPEIIVQANNIAESKGSCVLFLDDFHKIDESTSRIMYELLLERAIGDYKLDDRVAIICAMNDSEENGLEGMEPAIKGRMSIIPFIFNFDNWITTFGGCLHPYISSFLKSQPTFTLESENTSIEQSASPRAWEDLSKNFYLYTEEFLIANIDTLSSMIMTPEASSAFSNHVRYLAKINLGGIVKKKEKIDLKSLSEIDKLLYAYIVNYVNTPNDAVYLIELMNEAAIDKTAANFLGFLAGEIATIYKKHLEDKDSSNITMAQSIIIDKLIGEYTHNKYTLTSKERTALDLEFKSTDTLLQVISSYIL